MKAARILLLKPHGRRCLSESIPTLDVNKNLKLRAIAIDINVLIGNEFDSHVKKDAKVMLKEKEMSFLAGMRSKAKEENLTRNVYDLKDEIHGISDIQTKYMKKISMKVGGGGIEGLVNAMDSAANRGSNKGDAAMLKESKTNQINQNAQIVKPSKWLIQYGFGDTLDYANQRSMQLLLLARRTTPSHVVEALLSQLAGTKLDVIVDDGEQSIETKMRAQMQTGLGMKASEILVVSALDEYLAAAQNCQYYTCRFRGPGAEYSSSQHTHYSASNSIEIQDIIDELNKVSFRSGAFSFRQY